MSFHVQSEILPPLEQVLTEDVVIRPGPLKEEDTRPVRPRLQRLMRKFLEGGMP